MKREILDFTYRPKADKKKAYSVFGILVMMSVVFVIASVISPLYKGLISLVAVGVFVAALTVYSRYMLGEYAYVVANCGEDNVMFIVTKSSGKRVSTLCNIALVNIGKVRYEKASAVKQEKIENGVRRFNYCPSMSPEYMIVIEAAVGQEKMKICLEGSEALAARLSEDSRAAILNRAEDSDEK